MQMRCVGKGVYHSGPGGIEQPGDFGWRIDGPQVDDRGNATSRPGGIQIVLHCPRSGTCSQWVREKVPHGDADGRRYWCWDGNWERPTITPSLGCDDLARRCGQHMTITAGEISGNTPGQWVRRPRAAFGVTALPICGNCDTEVPPGCSGLFKDDGTACALIRAPGVGVTDHQTFCDKPPTT